VNEGVPDCDQATENQFCDPELEGQCFDQNLPQGLDDGKFDSTL
jgi:hypothetical protein